MVGFFWYRNYDLSRFKACSLLVGSILKLLTLGFLDKEAMYLDVWTDLIEPMGCVTIVTPLNIVDMPSMNIDFSSMVHNISYNHL